MKEYFPLDKDEIKLERMIIFCFTLVILTIAIGLCTQWQGRYNFDRFLIPICIFSGGCFYLLNGYNGVTKGNLVVKYTPVGIPFLIQYLFRKAASFPAEKARLVTARLLGIVCLLITTVLFFLGTFVIVKGV